MKILLRVLYWLFAGYTVFLGCYSIEFSTGENFFITMLEQFNMQNNVVFVPTLTTLVLLLTRKNLAIIPLSTMYSIYTMGGILVSSPLWVIWFTVGYLYYAAVLIWALIKKWWLAFLEEEAKRIQQSQKTCNILKEDNTQQPS